MQIDDDAFLRSRWLPDQWKPDVQHRTLLRKQIGSWLFGLLPVYVYYYSDWNKDENS